MGEATHRLARSEAERAGSVRVLGPTPPVPRVRMPRGGTIESLGAAPFPKVLMIGTESMIAIEIADPAGLIGPKMDRLDFVLPEFTRLSWVSDAARTSWEPRIQRIVSAWFEIEWLSILEGVRSCCLTIASPEELLKNGKTWAKLGLNALPIEIQGTSNYGYASSAVRPELGRPFVFRVVLGMPKDVAEFQKAWEAGDQDAIGRFLGYPDCCREFFQQTWVDDGLVDTTWAMGANTSRPSHGDCVEVDGPAQANILWRWVGPRTVSHLPCRFDCGATVELADRLIKVGRDAGHAREMDWLLEILDWPVEWSALHGIAEIKTPILRVSTRTDATSRKYVVRRRGGSYPPEGARGLSFPYQTPPSPILTGSESFKKGLDNLIQIAPPQPLWYATDNGFPSSIIMDRSHKPIIDLAKSILGESCCSVLDLGCGNGALLKKLRQALPTIEPYGIEIDESRVDHARILNADIPANFAASDIFSDDPDTWPGGPQYDLALLMPGRLIEATRDRSEALKAWIKRHCVHVLIYAYGDWLTRFGDLRSLAAEVGLATIGRGNELADLACWVESSPPRPGDLTGSRAEIL